MIFRTSAPWHVSDSEWTGTKDHRMAVGFLTEAKDHRMSVWFWVDPVKIISLVVQLAIFDIKFKLMSCYILVWIKYKKTCWRNITCLLKPPLDWGFLRKNSGFKFRFENGICLRKTTKKKRREQKSCTYYFIEKVHAKINPSISTYFSSCHCVRSTQGNNCVIVMGLWPIANSMDNLVMTYCAIFFIPMFQRSNPTKFICFIIICFTRTIIFSTMFLIFLPSYYHVSNGAFNLVFGIQAVMKVERYLSPDKTFTISSFCYRNSMANPFNCWKFNWMFSDEPKQQPMVARRWLRCCIQGFRPSNLAKSRYNSRLLVSYKYILMR